MPKPLLFFFAALALAPFALAGEPKSKPGAEPGRRDSERAGKSAVDPELQKRIDKTIDQARACLTKACAAPPGKPPLITLFKHGAGEEALVGLALVQSGSPPQDPLVQRIWADLQALASGKLTDPNPSETYSLALQLLFADAMMHAPSGKSWPPAEERDQVLAWMSKLAERLAAGCDGGTWTYACKAPVYGVREAKPKGYKVGPGGLGLGTPALEAASKPKGSFDHSNTQYGILGLKAALLNGVTLRNEFRWDFVLQHFLSTQWKDGPKVKLQVATQERAKPKEGAGKSGRSGFEETFTSKEEGPTETEAQARGWSYQPPHNGGQTTGMTAAGLAAMLVARSEAGRLIPADRKLVDASIRDAVAWFQQNWRMPVNGYDMYGVERMGVLGNLKSIGTHNWYEELARELVATQTADGAWASTKAFPNYGDTANTALSLLVLCRGTREAYARPYTIGELPPAK